MYEHKLPRPLDRGVGVTMEILGGKWKSCLIHNIRNGVRRPSDLHRLNPAAAPRVLNQQLRELEAHGMVGKVVHPGLPLKVEYFLTSQGESLLAIVDAMESWGVTFGEAFRQRMAGKVEAASAARP